MQEMGHTCDGRVALPSGDGQAFLRFTAGRSFCSLARGTEGGRSSVPGSVASPLGESRSHSRACPAGNEAMEKVAPCW